MGLWDHLFDSDYRQREDINLLRSVSGAAQSQAAIVSRKVKAQQRTIERQELLLETLYRIVLGKGLVTEQEFKDLVAQVDLEDGYEDGRIGADRVAKAPKCGNCQKPVNRKRTHCVYCNTEIPESVRKRKRGSAYRR